MNDDYQAIADCFNKIHVRLGQQMTANDVKDILNLRNLINDARSRADDVIDTTTPSVILEASKGR
ncbi:MAG: hypothetical protein [Bacteriophage sp.]|nr:MAG: hypothetical protein [Bacteriophage sp.]